ncbi:hypothetical protein C0J50_1145 [Silurus asotus]|uniref:Uncharacterized protein n=1 Tax=Silurus asotus TaxID=30991 RepID=A0AAD5FEG9_SILAS|nr:hypothetical protein C0J50_1145 [Silurus asotus]
MNGGNVRIHAAQRSAAEGGVYTEALTTTTESKTKQKTTAHLETERARNGKSGKPLAELPRRFFPYVDSHRLHRGHLFYRGQYKGECMKFSIDYTECFKKQNTSRSLKKKKNIRVKSDPIMLKLDVL